MKRSRLANEAEMESFNVASILMLLSGDRTNVTSRHVFECKTCSRQFSSFQALGGHRASHKKPKLSSSSSSNEDDRTNQSIKPKVHECSICGLEFAIGQALGGHMRRHRATINEGLINVKKKKSNDSKGLLLNLNLPPLDNEIDYRRLELGLGCS